MRDLRVEVSLQLEDKADTEHDREIVHDIVFDLGKVLVHFDWDIMFRRLSPHLPAHRGKLLKDDKEGFKRLFLDPLNRLEKGQITFPRFHEISTEILGVSIPIREFHHMWCDIFHPVEEMLDLGRALSRCYRTWLASNTSRAHYEWIMENFPQVAFYRDAALSFELGVMKPSKEYYQKVIELFGLDPPRTVFIDDLHENVQGAIRSEMIGIMFESRERLIQQLHELGVSCGEKTECGS